jgi:cytochrome b561
MVLHFYVTLVAIILMGLTMMLYTNSCIIFFGVKFTFKLQSFDFYIQKLPLLEL